MTKTLEERAILATRKYLEARYYDAEIIGEMSVEGIPPFMVVAGDPDEIAFCFVLVESGKFPSIEGIGLDTMDAAIEAYSQKPEYREHANKHVRCDICCLCVHEDNRATIKYAFDKKFLGSERCTFEMRKDEEEAKRRQEAAKEDPTAWCTQDMPKKWFCSACGTGYPPYANFLQYVHYCPNCGRKVVTE